MAPRAETRPEARRMAKSTGRLAICALLGLFGAEPALALYPKKGDSDPHAGVRDARRRVIQGIDVSRWQDDIDWQKVKDAGTRFAFIKATEGGDHLDPMFRKNWAEAKKAGVPRGAYHFVYWCRPAKDQVRWFKRHIPRDPVRQRHVERRARLAHREVLVGVDRISGDVRPPGGERCGAVALVDIAIDDQHTAYRPLLHQPHRSQSEIVEHAIARTGVAQRVMAPAGAVGGIAMLQRQHRGEPGAAGHDLRAGGDLRGDRKADPALLVRRHPRFQHLGHIIGIMHRLEPAARHRLGRMPGEDVALLQQKIADQAVLVPLILATRRGGCDVMRVMDDGYHTAKLGARPPDS